MGKLSKLFGFHGSFDMSARGVNEERKLKELLIASGFFEPDFYLRQNPDVASANFDPATHYIRHGGVEGRNPSPKFDAGFYLSKHLDVRSQGINPLLHYLQYGRLENRVIQPLALPAARPDAPPETEWEQTSAHAEALNPKEPSLDIIVPVYKGYNETANCLFTAIQARFANQKQFEIVVVDDASPQPELSVLLDKLSELKLITLVRNKENIGFVGSVNIAMQLHTDRDVILLNSDTEVYGNWVDRIERAAYCASNIGTVTPMSNNATICSYPKFAGDFDAAFEVTFAELDQLASEVNAGQIVDIPTAVGFCMYVRRECLHEAGLFDRKAFKTGYGEENDFSKRIAARGWRNVLAGDIFVRHLGRVSFGATANERLSDALAIINSRYPSYHKEIAAYITADPPSHLRRNLDIARLRRATGGKAILFVLHNLGGGTSKHVMQMCHLLANEGVGSFLLQPDTETGSAVLSHPAVNHLSVVGRIDLKHGLAAALELFDRLNIIHIHIHHLLGFGSAIGQFVQTVAHKRGIGYDFTIHDYLPICPRLDMVDDSGIYCDNTDLSVCESCIQKNGSLFGDVSVWQWREDYNRLLSGARKLFVPDDDVKMRVQRFLPSLALSVRPHHEELPDTIPFPIDRKQGEKLHVGIIGAINFRKGSAVLLRLAEDAARRKLPIKYTVFGYTDQPQFAECANVAVTGGYDERDLLQLMRRAECHLSLFPAVWPETYSYTLSQSYFAGVYPVTFELGAIARRIRAVGWGRVLPLDIVLMPSKVNDALLSLRPEPRPADWASAFKTESHGSMLSDYYELGIA